MFRAPAPLGLLLAIVAVVAAACGSGDGGETSSAATSETSEVGTTLRPTDPTCEGAAPIELTSPAGGWIGGEPTPALVIADTADGPRGPVAEAPGLATIDVPPVEAIDASSRVVSYCTVDGTGRFEARSDRWVVTLTAGGAIEIERSRLAEPLPLLNLATDTTPTDLADGRQLIRSDLFADHSLRTVWLVRPDGWLAKVRSTGENAPDVSGWPTTTAGRPDGAPPGEAALSLDQLQSIAEAVLAEI